MKYYSILVVHLILLVSLSGSALSQFVVFEETYGGAESDEARSVQQTTDGGYVMVGSTNSEGAGHYDVYLIKTDSLGATVWTETYGNSRENQGHYVQETSDGGFIITGFTVAEGDNDRDILLIKTNASGSEEWTKQLGDSTWDDRGRCVQQTFDGGYIIAGGTVSPASDTTYDVYLVKTDASGGLEWSKSYGGDEWDHAYSVQQTLPDSGYIITGGTESIGAGGRDLWLLKTDQVGDTTETKTYGTSGYDIGLSVRQTMPDLGFIVSGQTDPLTADTSDVYLIKTYPSLEEGWSHTYGGSEYDGGYSVKQTFSDSGYIISGTTQSFGADSSNVYLVKIDADGDTLWTRTYGGSGNDWGREVQQTSDDGFIVCGFTYSSGSGKKDAYLIKIDARGPVLLGAEASDHVLPGKGIDSDDRVVLTFDEHTNKATIDTSNIDNVLRLSNGHTWKDGAGEISGVLWNEPGDSLVVLLSTNSSPPTIAVGDIITPDSATITDTFGNPVVTPAVLYGSFDPPDTIPPSDIEDISVVAGSETDSSVTLTWTAVGDDGIGGGPASYYNIRYSSELIDSASFNTAAEITGEPVPAEPGSTEVFVLAGLTPETLYYLAMKVADEDSNWSGISNVDTGRTLPPDTVEYYQLEGEVFLDWSGITDQSGSEVWVESLSYTALDTTDTSGQYSFEDLAEDDYTVTVTHEGFVPADTSLRIEGNTQLDVTLRKLGDLGGDGDVDVSDLVLMVGLILEDTTGFLPTHEDSVAADMNEDAAVDILDVVLLLRGILELDGPVLAGVGRLVDVVGIELGIESVGGDVLGVTVGIKEAEGVGGVELWFGYDGEMYEPGVVETIMKTKGISVLSGEGRGLVKVLVYGLEGLGGVEGRELCRIDMRMLVSGRGDGTGLRLEKVIVADISGVSRMYELSGVREGGELLMRYPLVYGMSQNYPNPFNPSTTIVYEIPEDGAGEEMRIWIYDLRGRLVKRLVEGEGVPGRHEVHWGGRNDRGERVSSGVYFYRLQTGDYVSTRKLVVIR